MPKQPKDQLIRFGAGRYEGVQKDEVRTSIKEMRSVFLQKASELVPEVSDSLENELIELYQQIPLFFYEADIKRRKKRDEGTRLSWHKVNRPAWTVIENAWDKRKPGAPFAVQYNDYYAVPDKGNSGSWEVPLNSPPHTDPKITVFVEKLFEWSRRHDLDAAWCREHAYETLDLWCHYQDYRKARFWAWEARQPPYYLRPITLPPFDPPELVFKHVTLYPSVGFRQDEKRKIMEAFETQLEAFLDKRDESAQKVGMVPTPQKLDLSHFEWLALHQVKKPPMTCKQIFDLYQEQSKSKDLPRLVTTPRAVEKAVKGLADELGLPPRYAGRGRRPKPPVKRP